MKRTIKKWLSLLLTAAMILSLGVTAFASEPSTTQDLTDSEYTESSSDPVIGDIDDLENLDSNQNPTGRTINATLMNEGALPADILRLVLPVTSSESVAQTFNMYLDPNDLIQASFGARYLEGASEDNNPFAAGTHVYFKNAEADTDGKMYSKTSDKLSIVNKSNVDVNVSLDAEFSKGKGDKDFKQFSFVDSEAALADAKGAAMFLEMQAVINTAAQGEEEASSSNVTPGVFKDVEYPGPTATAVTDSNTTLHYTVKELGDHDNNASTPDTVEDVVAHDVSFIKSVDWVWSDTISEDDQITLNKEFGKTANSIVFEFTTNTSGGVTVTGLDTTDAAVWGEHSDPSDTSSAPGPLYGYNMKNAFTTSPLAATATSTSTQVLKKIDSKDVVMATITFNFDRSVIDAEAAAIKDLGNSYDSSAAAKTKVTFATTPVVSPAQVKSSIAKIDGAYNTIWYQDNSANPTLEEYRYQLDSSYTEDTQFNSMDFNLTAAINTDKAWEDVDTDPQNGFGFTVIWTVTPVSSDDGTAPSVTVTSAPTAAGTNSTVVMSVDLGSGSKAATGIKQFRYTNGTNIANIAVTTTAGQAASYVNGVLTVKTPTAVFNGSNWKVIFTLEDGSEFEVPVNIKVKG